MESGFPSLLVLLKLDILFTGFSKVTRLCDNLLGNYSDIYDLPPIFWFSYNFELAVWSSWSLKVTGLSDKILFLILALAVFCRYMSWGSMCSIYSYYNYSWLASMGPFMLFFIESNWFCSLIWIGSSLNLYSGLLLVNTWDFCRNFAWDVFGNLFPVLLKFILFRFGITWLNSTDLLSF